MADHETAAIASVILAEARGDLKASLLFTSVGVGFGAVLLR